MKTKCSVVSVEIRKSQHKYIIGPKGVGIAEILQDTGVSVEMPPTESSLETVTLRVFIDTIIPFKFRKIMACFFISNSQGPQEKLGVALTKLYEKANSVCTSEVKAPSWIHRHIIGKKGSGIRAITQDYPKVIVFCFPG